MATQDRLNDGGDREPGKEPSATAPSSESPSMMSSVGALLGGGLLQRKLARRLARRRADEGGVDPDAGAAVTRASGSPGTPLPQGLQRKFESSLGADLSGVRVHTSADSADAAESVSAKAYTVGQNIHFAQGEYEPSSAAGEHLLAHEVAHTVQQTRTAASAPQCKLEVSAPQDAAEAEADRAADAMVQGAAASPLGEAPVSGQAQLVQRRKKKKTKKRDAPQEKASHQEDGSQHDHPEARKHDEGGDRGAHAGGGHKGKKRHEADPARDAALAAQHPTEYEEWQAYPKIHRHFDRGFADYVDLHPLYGAKGVANPAAYIYENIVAPGDLKFFHYSTSGHKDFKPYLAKAQTKLGSHVPVFKKFFAFVPRRMDSRVKSGKLSEHALGQALDIDEKTNPHIFSYHIMVIKKLTGIDLGGDQPIAVMRQASDLFKASYNEDWVAQQREELAQLRSHPTHETQAALRAQKQLMGAIRDHRGELDQFAKNGLLGLDEQVIEAFRESGLVWGGGFRGHKDFMHFELPGGHGSGGAGGGAASRAPVASAPRAARPPEGRQGEGTAPTPPATAAPHIGWNQRKNEKLGEDNKEGTWVETIRRVPVEGLASIKGGRAIVLVPAQLMAKLGRALSSPGAATPAVEVLIHLHGFNTHGYEHRRDEGVYRIEQQLEASSRPMVAILPQVEPDRSTKSPRLPDADGLSREVLRLIFPGKAVDVSGTVLTGFSGGGGQVIDALDNRKPREALTRISLAEVVLFDGIYDTGLADQLYSFLDRRVHQDLTAVHGLEDNDATAVLLQKGLRFRGYYNARGHYEKPYTYLDGRLKKELLTPARATLGVEKAGAYGQLQQNIKIEPVPAAGDQPLTGEDMHESTMGNRDRLKAALDALPASGALPVVPSVKKHEDARPATAPVPPAVTAKPADPPASAPRAHQDAQPSHGHQDAQPSRAHQDAQRSHAPAADAAAIRSALGAVVVVERAGNEKLLNPLKIFELVPWNTEAKANAFRPVQAAVKELRKAQQAVGSSREGKAKEKAIHRFEEASKKLEKATLHLKQYVLSQLDHIERNDAQTRKLRADEREAKARLAALEKHGDKASPEQREEAQRALAATTEAERSRHQELVAQLEGADYGLADTQRRYYRVVVDGEDINLWDHVEAYSTSIEAGLDGKAASEKRKGRSTVTEVLEQSTLSTSVKKILTIISDSEGGFSTVNTYDKAVLTWGMMQWTGGDRSDLVDALSIVKRVAPDAFARRFRKYGIDVDEANKQLVITDGDGGQRHGGAAAKAVQDSPALTGVMSRAGMDAEIQRAELTAAVETKIDGPLHRTIGVPRLAPKGDAVPEDEVKEEAHGKHRKHRKHRGGSRGVVRVRIGDIFTSEYGVGIVADRTVHGGFPKEDELSEALARFLHAHGHDPEHVQSWAADGERALLRLFIAGWAKRAALFVTQGCSQAAGSFQR